MIRISDTNFAAYLVEQGQQVSKMEGNGCSKTVFLLFDLEEADRVRLHNEYLRSEFFRVTMIKDTLTKSIKSYACSKG